MKSSKNKTLDLPLSECGEYLKRCAAPTAPLSAADCADRVICGDFFAVSKYLPEHAFSLVVADPPYNLRKDYAGEVFSPKKAEEYAAFSRRWLAQVKRLAAENASVYVCCDWRTSVILGAVLPEFFTVRSRITWQREKGRGAKKNWKNCMEDIWFCTVSDEYTFHLDAVKQVRRVKAPYRVNGENKDWESTAEGRVRRTCPSNFWDDITVPFWSMARKADRKAAARQLFPRRSGVRSLRRRGHHGRGREKAGAALYAGGKKRTVLRVEHDPAGARRNGYPHSGL